MKPDRIRAIMRERKLSCSEIAFLAGVPKRTMESYIQGRRNVPEWVAISILAIKNIAELSTQDQKAVV
jgi:DNA-binding transcriptional regulator YiaG